MDNKSCDCFCHKETNVPFDSFCSACMDNHQVFEGGITFD